MLSSKQTPVFIDGRLPEQFVRREEKWDARDELTCQKAIQRFDLHPRPMGIPDDIDPPPKIIEIDWPINPIPIEVQRNVGKRIVKRGEFGW